MLEMFLNLFKQLLDRQEWLRCMQVVKCCTSNYSKSLYRHIYISIKKSREMK
jgi:hypothetical protein